MNIDLFGNPVEHPIESRITRKSHALSSPLERLRIGTRVCNTCGEEKPINGFSPDTERGRYYCCNDCRVNIYRTDITARAKKLISSAKTRARKREITFNLDMPEALKFIVARITIGVCQKTGWKFELGKSDFKHNPYAPSINRISSWAGYIFPDNIEVICDCVNRALGVHGEEMLCQIADAIRTRR